MPNCIARIFEPLFRLLNPRSGRHRAATVRRQEARAWAQPYVLISEERQERRSQQVQQLERWLATYGTSPAPRWIHGLEAAG
jgi:hypothetical protein